MMSIIPVALFLFIISDSSGNVVGTRNETVHRHKTNYKISFDSYHAIETQTITAGSSPFVTVEEEWWKRGVGYRRQTTRQHSSGQITIRNQNQTDSNNNSRYQNQTNSNNDSRQTTVWLGLKNEILRFDKDNRSSDGHRSGERLCRIYISSEVYYLDPKSGIDIAWLSGAGDPWFLGYLIAIPDKKKNNESVNDPEPQYYTVTPAEQFDERKKQHAFYSKKDAFITLDDKFDEKGRLVYIVRENKRATRTEKRELKVEYNIDILSYVFEKPSDIIWTDVAPSYQVGYMKKEKAPDTYDFSPHLPDVPGRKK